MARITKAELEKMVKEKDNLIDTFIKKNVELQSKLAAIHNKEDNSFLNSVTYKQMDKEIKQLQDEIKAHKTSLKAKEDTIKSKIDTIQQLLKENEQLKQDLENVNKLKNERNAGRKERFTSEEKVIINRLRLANNSYRAIAKEMGCGVGTVHKIIKEMEEE